MTALTGDFLAQGMTTRWMLARSAYARALYELGSADARGTERMRRALEPMIAGLDVRAVDALVRNALEAAITPYVFAEATELIREHQARGHDVVIVSASGEDVVGPIARLLGVEYWIATRMEAEDGRYTGRIEFFNYGPAKAERIVELARMHGWDLGASYAYSDSVTDEPMLALVGHGAVVNPSRSLAKLARERGWEVLRFVRQVPLRRRRCAAWTWIGTAVGVGVLAVWWTMARTRGRVDAGRH
jgi:HAD superfamily hydrolase (TIGR01490 family)